MQDEARLVEQARHDPGAFAALYDRYAERIYAYAQRETGGDLPLAQDAVSATFEKALKHLPRYEWRGVSFGAWLYRIARNEINMARRRQKWTIPFPAALQSGSDVEAAVGAGQEADALQQALARLSGRDQEILRLRYYEDLGHAEIAEVLNCSPRNAAVRLHRALSRLRQRLEHAQREAQEVAVDVSR